MRRPYLKNSFTILEIIIVIIVIGVVTSLALPRLFAMVRRAQAVEAIVMLRSVHDAVQRCLLMNDIDFLSLDSSDLDRFRDACGNADDLDIGNPFDAPGAHFTWDGSIETGSGAANIFQYVILAFDKKTGYPDFIVFAYSNGPVAFGWGLDGLGFGAPTGGVHIVGFGVYQGIVKTGG